MATKKTDNVQNTEVKVNDKVAAPEKPVTKSTKKFNASDTIPCTIVLLSALYTPLLLRETIISVTD